MNNEYKYVGRALTPGIAQELIKELYAGQTARRQEIERTVRDTHLKRGGKPAAAKTHDPAGLALTHMHKSGIVENPSQGVWVVHSERGISEDPDSEEVIEPNLDSQRIIGDGTGSVYVYYYPTYRHYAESQGERAWACKVGRAGNDPDIRIRLQASTALPEYPEVGLVIKTDEPEILERAMHDVLKLNRKAKEDAPGTEWFITSPSEVEKIYDSIFANS